MPKRSQDSYDDFGLPPLEPGYQPDPETQKRKQGCIFALLGLTALIFCGLVGLWGYTRYTASRPIPTPTFPPDDGIPAQMESGLQQAVYGPNGQPLASVENFLPVALPITLTQESLIALDALAYPEGAFFDALSGQLVVFGPPAMPGAHPASDDFLVALRAVYSGQPIAVSIDPTNDPVSQNVRYEGPIKDTHFGWVLFEADRRMKTLSMGQDNLTNQAVSANVAGYANLIDLELTLGFSQGQNEVRRRFWFTVPVAEIEQNPDGQGMLISALSLAVKTEYLDENWETLASQPPDPAGQAFASHLTDYYGDYAREYPVFSELDALARWMTLAHWLRQVDLPLQTELWLVQTSAAYDAPHTTPAITVTSQHESGNFIQTLKLWGGVDFDIKVKIREATQATQNYLNRLSEKFKANFTTDKVEASLPGLIPLSPVGLARGLLAKVDLPVSPVLTLGYSSTTAWQLQVPQLKQVGDNFVFINQAGQTTLMMLDGSDASTGADLFVNRAAGYWLTVSANGYDLKQGQFLSDGQFSYLQGQEASFNVDGQISTDGLTGVEVEYVYSDGRLSSIRQPQGQVDFLYEGEMLRGIRSANERVALEYADGFLTEISLGGVLHRKFEYDAQGRLTRELDSVGLVLRQIEYDESGQVAYQFENGQGVLYDWLPGGAVRLAAGPALAAWREADPEILNELKIALRLARHPQVDHLVFARKVNEKVVVLAGDKSYSLPAYLLQNPERLRHKLANLLTVNAGETVLISSGSIHGVAFQALFPQAVPLTVETVDEARVLGNLDKLGKIDRFTPETASVLNAVPLPSEMKQVDLPEDDGPDWQGLKEKFGEIIERAGFGLTGNPSALQLQAALENKASVLVVVAHGDSQQVYLPDGTRFSPEELTQTQKDAIAAQSPLVILLSCNTGAVATNTVSFSQRLLDVGPRMVVSPNGDLPVEAASQILEIFLQKSGTIDPVDAIFEAIQTVYPNWLISTEEGLDYFFEFRTDNFVTAQEAA
jgi:hypothetical protein